MSGIKGLVILTRLDYIESNYGRDRLKEFFDKIKVDDQHPLNQPVIISKEYPEILLKNIDDLMVREYFNNDPGPFLEIGHWNARHLMPRYFQIYIDEKNPQGFLRQMVILRDVLIGLGDMHLVDLSEKSFLVHIHYGQPFLESVRLSEWGFIVEGCRLCGARNIRWEYLGSKDNAVEYQIDWD